MPMHAIDPDQARKRQLLFEELKQAHAQAAALASITEHRLTDSPALVTEFRKAADIVARLRALDGLESA